MNTEALAAALRKRRGHLRLTQVEAASKAGLSVNGYRQHENGGVEQQPREQTKHGLETAMGWPSGTVDALLEGRMSTQEAVVAKTPSPEQRPMPDVSSLLRELIAYGDQWFWCRRCNRPEHGGWAMDGCIRVGPFESEHVAAKAGWGLTMPEREV